MAFSICYWANYILREKLENEVIAEVRKRRGGWPGFEVFVWRRLTSCWILRPQCDVTGNTRMVA